MSSLMRVAFAVLLLGSLAEGQEPNRARITGLFVDRQGNGVPDARVLHRVWPGTEFPGRTDEEGRFEGIVEWPAHHRDTWYECSVVKLGFARWELDDDLQPGDERDLGTVTLEPGGGVTGLLRGEDGPLVDGLVVVVPAEQIPESPVTDGEGGPEWRQVVARGRTDAQGRFRVEGLPLGNWGLWGYHETTWWASGAVFEVREGELAMSPDLVLRALPPEHRIEGVVVGPDGEAVAGAEVKTRIPMERYSLAVTSLSDADGRFTLYLPSLPSEPQDLRVEPATDDYWRASLPYVEAGARDVLVRLPRTIELDVRVVEPDGAPVESYGWGLTVNEAHYATSQGARQEPRPGGRASIRVPEGLEIELEIRSDAHERVDADLTGWDGGEILVELTPLPIVAGFVTFDGQPVPGAHVDLVNRNADYLHGLLPNGWDGLYYAGARLCAETDGDGRFRIPNEWAYFDCARAWADGYAPTMVEDVHVGNVVFIELSVGGSLAGHVRLPRGSDPHGLVSRT